jgi:hypothetical protein
MVNSKIKHKPNYQILIKIYTYSQAETNIPEPEYYLLTDC